MLSHLPYDARWTSKLLRRDVRNLKTKFNTMFFKGTKASSEDFIGESGCQDTIEESSIEATGTEVLRDDSSEHSAASTAPTEVSNGSAEVTPKALSTLYELLDTRLKAMYASRDRNMSHDERWQLRGSFLVLSMVMQACASNPIHEIFRDEMSALNETKLLLEMLQHSTSNTCGLSAEKISQMPRTPYTRRSDHHIRYDSAFSTVPIETGASRVAMRPTKLQAPAHFWHTFLEAIADQANTVSITEGLLGHVWPDRDVVETLNRIGDPGKVFHDEEFAELRLKFREMLFPEYNDLVNSWQLQIAV